MLSAEVSAVIMMTGMSSSSSRRCIFSSTRIPSMPGMIISSSTSAMSVPYFSSCAMHSAPSAVSAS